MDIPRKSSAKKRLIRRIIIGVVILLVVAGVSVALSRLKVAAPTVDGATLWPDTVKRGPMLRQVRGLGTLVAEDVLWIPALSDGRVVRINVLPGTVVKPDTIIMELSNPELQVATLDAEFNLKAAEAKYTDLRVQLQSQGFDKEATAAQVSSDYKQAQLKADRDKKLSEAGLVPDLDVKLSTAQADELGIRNGLEQKRLGIINESVQAQLAAQRVQIDQLKALYALKKQQVEELKVRAGVSGTLQQLGAGSTAGGTAAVPFEAGQRVTAGTILAKIAQPQKLKAELKITETEAKDILYGQNASIDTRNGIIPGKVSRIDPAATGGTVTVDVKLMGELPQGARPDLSVDGTIEVERLADVVYVGRPTIGQPNSTISLFKYEPDGKYADRVQVKLGKASVSTIQVLDGLRVGDKVILSDMNAYDQHDRIRVN